MRARRGSDLPQICCSEPVKLGAEFPRHPRYRPEGRRGPAGKALPFIRRPGGGGRSATVGSAGAGRCRWPVRAAVGAWEDIVAREGL